ncbi:hypothetical protein GCM10029963_07170 [Micromonospora andamanensis]
MIFNTAANLMINAGEVAGVPRDPLRSAQRWAVRSASEKPPPVLRDVGPGWWNSGPPRRGGSSRRASPDLRAARRGAGPAASGARTSTGSTRVSHPHEQDRLLVHVAADVARRRRERGLRLNYPEAVAVITAFLLEGPATGSQWST